MTERVTGGIFIINPQGAYDSNEYVTQDEYNAWAKNNTVTATDPNGITVDVVGGDDKISVTDGTTTVGYDNVQQPGDGTGATTYSVAATLTSNIDDQERVDRGPGVLGLGDLRLTSIDIVQDVSYPGGDDTGTTTTLAAEVTPVLTDKRLDSNFTGYSDFPGNDAFGGLTVEETAALDRAIINLAAGFNEKNPFESRLSIENAARASAQAADLLDYFGDKLTTADRADLETIINVGRQVARVTADVEQAVGGAIESLRQISLTSEDQTPNEIANSISDRAFEVYRSLTRDEKMVLRTLFPDLDKQLGALQNITGSQNPFVSSNDFRVTPYTANSFQPLNSTDTAVDRAVAAWIAENGSISESEYARIESAVLDSRSIATQKEGVKEDKQPGIDDTIRRTSATAGDDPSVQTDILTIEDLNTNPLGVKDPTLVQNLLKALDTPKDTQKTVSTALAEYFGIDNPLGLSAIDRAVKLVANQVPGVSSINQIAGTVRTLDNATTTLGSDQLSAQDLAYATLSVLALANPQAALLLKALDYLGLKPGPAVTQSSTIVPTGSGGGGGGTEDEFPPGDIDYGPIAINSDDPSALGYDPENEFVDNGTGLLVLPEDQFVETDGGLYVLPGEAETDIENSLPEPPNDDPSAYPNGLPYDDDGNLNPGWAINPETGEPYYAGGDYVDPGTLALAQEARQQAILANARNQAALQAQRSQANDGDWRVRLRLAPGANYLYKLPADQQGILQPLAVTDGVVFPYMPQIDTNYHANYNEYDLTHSNYRGYFYRNSYVGEINLRATFTAQDSAEASYMLAVIHFFRSVTKMFYGQDAQRGTPPPLVFLEGLGEYQFNLHSCVVSNFSYTLPNDVDYIRARSPNVDGTSLLQRRDRQSLPTNPFDAVLARISAAGLKKGAIPSTPAPAQILGGINRPTYVPTKLDMNLTLLPIQTREQVSKEFSLKQFANGQLIKGGFW